MQNKQHAATSHDVAPTSTSGGPGRFEVDIAAAEPGSASRSVAVTGTDPASGARMTRNTERMKE